MTEGKTALELAFTSWLTIIKRIKRGLKKSREREKRWQRGKKGSGCGKVQTIYLNHTQCFLQSSLPLPLSSSPSPPSLPPMDGVALSQSGGAAHKDKRVAASVCFRRNKPAGQNEIQQDFLEEKLSPLWILVLILSAASKHQLKSCLHLTEDGEACMSWTSNTGSHVSSTPTSLRQPSLWAGKWNEDFLFFFFSSLPGNWTFRDYLSIGGHSSEGSGCECPLVWRPASSTPAPWITCLGL